MLFYKKVNGISQSDTGIDMFLYSGLIPERRIVQGQTIVFFQ